MTKTKIILKVKEATKSVARIVKDFFVNDPVDETALDKIISEAKEKECQKFHKN